MNGHRHSSFQGLELFQKGDVHARGSAQVHITEMHIVTKTGKREVALLKARMRERRTLRCEVGRFNANTRVWKVTRQDSLFRDIRASFCVNAQRFFSSDLPHEAFLRVRHRLSDALS